MNDYPYNFGRGGSISTVEVRNRVLRNTYWLLALSMIPTVLGAWIGVATGFSLFAATSPAMSLLAFFAIAFGFMFAIERTKNSSAGVFVLLGFTFFMGLIWQFTQIWNDFLFGIVFSGVDSMPITVALNNLVNTSTGVKEYNVDMAGAIIAALPTLLVYVIAGRYFVRGLTAGAVKG